MQLFSIVSVFFVLIEIERSLSVSISVYVTFILVACVTIRVHFNKFPERVLIGAWFAKELGSILVDRMFGCFSRVRDVFSRKFHEICDFIWKIHLKSSDRHIGFTLIDNTHNCRTKAEMGYLTK